MGDDEESPLVAYCNKIRQDKKVSQDKAKNGDMILRKDCSNDNDKKYLESIIKTTFKNPKYSLLILLTIISEII